MERGRGEGDMSYVVPNNNKPVRCNRCPFIDADSLNCTLMEDSYKYIELAYQHIHCPLIEIPTPHGDLVDLNDVVHPNDSMRRMTIDEQLRRTCEGWSADRKQYIVIEAEGDSSDF